MILTRFSCMHSSITCVCVNHQNNVHRQSAKKKNAHDNRLVYREKTMEWFRAYTLKQALHQASTMPNGNKKKSQENWIGQNLNDDDNIAENEQKQQRLLL